MRLYWEGTKNGDDMNKVALVTGGSRGIGRGAALRLAQDGMDVAFTYQKNTEAAEELAEQVHVLGRAVLPIRADMSDKDEVKAALDAVYKRFKGVDVLVNNVGIAKDSFFIMAGDSDIETVIDTNIKSMLYCSRYVASKMFLRGGRIINISSVSSLRAIVGQTIYSMTKGAVNSFTRTMAKEYAKQNILVNAIAPGFIGTDMLNDMPKEAYDKIVSEVPLRRMGTVEDVANLISFLASDASGYMTGQVLVLDGGLSL